MTPTAERILKEIAVLLSDERAELLAVLIREENRRHEIQASVRGKRLDSPDPEPSMRWVKEH